MFRNHIKADIFSIALYRMPISNPDIKANRFVIFYETGSIRPYLFMLGMDLKAVRFQSFILRYIMIIQSDYFEIMKATDWWRNVSNIKTIYVNITLVPWNLVRSMSWRYNRNGQVELWGQLLIFCDNICRYWPMLQNVPKYYQLTRTSLAIILVLSRYLIVPEAGPLMTSQATIIVSQQGLRHYTQWFTG